MNRYVPETILSALLFLPLFALVHIRLITKIFRIQRTLENKVIKRGFIYILLSINFLVLATLVISLNTISGFEDNVYSIFILQNLRIPFVIASVVLGYLGWIMPDWLKRRIRGKAWIVKQMDKTIEPKVGPIASSVGKKQNVVAVEVASE